MSTPTNGGTQASIEDLRDRNRRLEDRINRKLDALEEHLAKKLDHVIGTQTDHAVQLAELRVKSGVWGGLSGLATAIGAMLAWVFARS